MKRAIFLLSTVAAVAVVATTATFAASSGSAAAERLKVRIITCCPIAAGVWDPNHFKNYSAVAKKMNWNMQIAQTVPYGKADQVLGRWGADGVDIVFSTDNGFQQHMLKAAKRYPNTLWVTMSDMSTTGGLKNVAAYTVDWCQLGFAQGVVGALISKTHKIGGVGAIPILPATKTLAGMKFGANIARKGTQVLVKYSGDFIDGPKAQEVASAHIANGADVLVGITHGSISPQIAARVQDAGKFYIGSYGDETKFAPKATVTSGLLNFKLGYEKVARQRLAGTFTPGIFRGGIKDGFVKLTPLRLGFQGKQKQVDALLARVASGKLEIPNC